MAYKSSNFDDFDPYHKWLGIPKGKRPPTLYQLLGISPNETDVEVIATAVKRQQAFVSEFQGGPNHDAAAALLMELDKARSVLLDGMKRRKYDQKLRDARERTRSAAEGTGVLFGSGSRWVGEENSIVKPFAGIVLIICVAFAGMAFFSFKVLPWSKQSDVESTGQSPAQSPQLQSNSASIGSGATQQNAQSIAANSAALKTMQGKWKCVSYLGLDQKEVKSSDQDRRATIRGDFLTLGQTVNGERQTLTGKLALNATMRHFDFIGNDDKSSTQNVIECVGIYELEGDTLKLCYNEKRNGKAIRPQNLKDGILEFFKRIND